MGNDIDWYDDGSTSFLDFWGNSPTFGASGTIEAKTTDKGGSIDIILCTTLL